MNQLSLGIALKEEGISRVSTNAARFVRIMREYAVYYSKLHGSVTSDDLREYAARIGEAPHHCNAWGGIMRGPGWKVVGRAQSRIPGNHAREVRRWRYEG